MQPKINKLKINKFKKTYNTEEVTEKEDGALQEHINRCLTQPREITETKTSV